MLSSGVLCGLIVGTGSSISAVVATASTEGSTALLGSALAAPASMISKASGVAPLGSKGRLAWEDELTEVWKSVGEEGGEMTVMTSEKSWYFVLKLLR